MVASSRPMPENVIDCPDTSPWTLKLYLRMFIGALKSLRPLITEEVQVSGLENLVDGGPKLWMFKHEHWFDPPNLISFWFDVGCPSFKVLGARDVVVDSTLLSKIAGRLLSPILYVVHRTWRDKVSTEEDKELMRRENQKALERLRSCYEDGYHIIVAPEGQTQSDGRNWTIRSGVYNLCKVPREDRLDLIRCMPVGNTYDFMAGDRKFGRRRHLVFLSYGKPFLYEAVHPKKDESDKEYVQRDIKHFTDGIRRKFVDLTAITTSQLAGHYLMDHPGGELRLEELEDAVSARVDALSGIEGLIFDEALFEEEGRKGRVGNFYDTISELGYLVDGVLDTKRVLYVPPESRYKEENLLLYMVNRLRCIADQRPEVASALESVSNSSANLNNERV